MASPPRPARLPLLDALRGIAAIAVVLHHEPMLYGHEGPFTRAYLAVDFFFMLSGLVLTLAFEPKLRIGLPVPRFLAQRIARLWPIMAVGVLIGASAFWHHYGPAHLPALLLASLLLLPWPLGRGGLFRLDGPQWSVSYELLANAAHALLLWRLSNRALLGFALACGALLAWQAAQWGSVGMGDATPNWWGGFARVGYGYSLGVWLGRQFATDRARISPPLAWAIAALLPLTLLTAKWWPLGVVAGDLLAVFLLFPPALWAAAQVPMAGWPARAADALGRLSYPAYAVHGPILIWGALLSRAHPDLAPLLRPAALALTFAAAGLLAISPLARGIPLRRQG